MAKTVKAESKAFGYNYASLSDIAKQGYEIPKMRTETDPLTQKDYMYWYDKELNYWVRGAEIVIAEIKGSNKAQSYGAAISYARRYTVQMALGLATDDDKNYEQNEEPKKEEAPKKEKVTYCTKDQAKAVREILNDKQLEDMFKYYKINCVEQLTVQQASSIIKKGTNNGTVRYGTNGEVFVTKGKK